MFSTKGQEVKTERIDKSLQAGVVYAHIYDAKVLTSKNGKKKLELILEGPALENFEGWSVAYGDDNSPKFQGQSARVGATIYVESHSNSNPMKNDIMLKLITAAIELGLRDEVDNISANTLESWVAQCASILKGKFLYWFLTGKEDEYNGKTIVRLELPKIRFCSANEEKLDIFDRNNIYHYKSLNNKSVGGFEPVNDEFDGL